MLEIAGIIILGIMAQWLAWRTKVPAILPLILTGLLVGPISTLWTDDGSKWIEPIFNLTSREGLFPGQSLFYFVSLAIGVILFEGGLTLKRREIASVGPAIWQLISVGSIITFIGAGLAAHYIMELDWAIAFLFGGLVIVTGPTVIAPILQNVPLNRNVSTVLKWEGILIDPIGALVAVLVYEFIVSGQGGLAFSSVALTTFAAILVTGFIIGTLAALALKQLIVRDLIPHYLLNVFSLALVLAVFVLSDLFAHESGLLSVVVMGMVLANLNVPRLKEILYFKESMSVLLISVLFILLAANIDMDDLGLLLDWRCLALFGVIVFLLRPLGVFASTRKGGLNFNEKLFISWVGPRGIVAAGIASLFGLTLVEQGVAGAEYITPLVFMVVLGTVLLNATTARLVAKLLKVIQSASDGILIVGANRASRLIGQVLHNNGRHVVLIDSNEGNIKKAQNLGLEGIQANVYADDLDDQFELVDVGYLLAMTGSPDVNAYSCKKFKHIFGEMGTYRLITTEEVQKGQSIPENALFSPLGDYINVMEVARDQPDIHELPLESAAHFKRVVETLQSKKDTLPLFLRDADNQLHIITAQLKDWEIEEGSFLIYMGEELEEERVEGVGVE